MNTRHLPPTAWTTGTTEVLETGTWRAALARHIEAPAPCHIACPMNGDIAEWIGRARVRDFRGAWEVLTRHNPFPAVCGRICHHPCETACNRAGFDEPLAICGLERQVGDCALAAGWEFPPAEPPRVERIAIVGSGPSGLSAAFQLRRRGYPVTVLESRAELGGLMRYGIPAYRLPRAVLDGEIARIVTLGIDVRCEAPVQTPRDLARLRGEFDAVYLAFGAGRPKRLPALDYAQPWVVDGSEYLAQANAGVAPVLGRRLVVIGGGSAALDVARSARRAGHEVTILALERMAQMPAQREEVTDAIEEGVTVIAGAMLADVVDAGRLGLLLECVKVTFERGATSGQFTATPIAGSEFLLDADAIVPAIGQDPDLGAVSSLLDTDGALVKVDRRQATSLEGVYAGGDVASMARFVSEAIGMGKRAAQEIDRALGGPPSGAAEREPVVPFAAINTFYHPRQARAAAASVPAAERLEDNAEAQIGFDLEQALAEAQRCFSCGRCIECDNCVYYCPDLAVRRESSGYAVLADYCKGCGLCVKECPTGSMKMIEETR